MADERRPKDGEQLSGGFRRLRKAWLAAIVLMLAIVAGAALRVPVDQLSEIQFLEAFHAKRVIQANINYDPQLEKFAKISGKYKKVDKEGKEVVADFVTGTMRLTDDREKTLLASQVFRMNPPKIFIFRNFF